MSTPVTWLLDPTENFVPREGEAVVCDEAAFLQEALTPRSMLIQGEILCQWAWNVAIARRITYRSLPDPAVTVRALDASMPDDDVAGILQRLGSRVWEFERTSDLRAIDVLRWIDPAGPWFGDADREHAWQWLLWWSVVEDDLLIRLASLVQPHLASACEDPEIRGAYAIAGQNVAIEAIERALRIQQDAAGVPIPTKPAIPVPVRTLLLERFRLRMASEQVPDDFSLDEVNPAIRTAVGSELVAIAKSRQAIDRRQFETLERILGPSKVGDLRIHLPVADPGDVPDAPGDVLTWYGDRYIPWRLRYAEDLSGTQSRVQDLHRQFAGWILKHLPSMRSHPEDKGHLAWVKVDRLRHEYRDERPVTLLIIADGLGPGDIGIIQSALALEESLLVTRSDDAFTQIPTVTELTKPVIVAGDMSGVSVKEDEDRLSKIDTVVAALRDAADGDLFAWTLTQPDREYHFTYGKKELANRVQSRLQEVASGIVEVVRAFDDTRPFRIIVTSDHGRYVGETKRRLQTPEGLKSHGRAAWGPRTRQPDGDAEYDGEMVWLNPYSFGLSPDESYAVALGDNSFMTADGKTGVETNGHGGLSPEEVIVPWLELRRNLTFSALDIRVTGNGQSRKSGEFMIVVANPNHAAVTLRSLRLAVPQVTGPAKVEDMLSGRLRGSPAGTHDDAVVLDLEHHVIDAISSRTIRIELTPWAFTAEHQEVEAVMTLQLPSGEERRQTVAVEISTKSLYRSSLTIEDLA